MIATDAVGPCRFVLRQWKMGNAAGRKTHPVVNPATGEVSPKCPTPPRPTWIAPSAPRTPRSEMARRPGGGPRAAALPLQGAARKHANEVAAILTRENGKTADDAKAEVRRAIQMVEVACGMPSLMMGDSLNDVSAGIDCKTIRQPMGVCAGITPFNFPAMVPMWMYPFAIACGNTFMLKPSEKVPLTPTRMANCCTMPASRRVFNLMHGDKEAVDALLHHPLVKAVSFVGSTPVAKYIYTTAAAEGKRVQALGGAKNHLVVMPDADMPKTVEAIIGSAFGAAGERCLAGSVLVPVGDAAGPLLELLVRKKEMRIGDGSKAGVEMGPLVTSDHCQRVARLYREGRRGRREAAATGARVPAERRRLFPGPHHFRQCDAGDDHRAEEIFGPVLSVIRVKTLDEAIERW
jgi:malonate-semialdehyde dehydrogenase (acetylating)/methylmalonate-semialdehyde dehydrogenase